MSEAHSTLPVEVPKWSARVLGYKGAGDPQVQSMFLEINELRTAYAKAQALLQQTALAQEHLDLLVNALTIAMAKHGISMDAQAEPNGIERLIEKLAASSRPLDGDQRQAHEPEQASA